MAHPVFDPRYEQLGIREKKFYRKWLRPRIYNPKLGKGSKVYVITPKFYARHECIIEEADKDILNRVHAIHKQYPKDKYDYYQTESQRIGWYNEFFIDCNRNDERLYHPNINDPVIKVQYHLYSKKFLMA